LANNRIKPGGVLNSQRGCMHTMRHLEITRGRSGQPSFLVSGLKRAFDIVGSGLGKKICPMFKTKPV